MFKDIVNKASTLAKGAVDAASDLAVSGASAISDTVSAGHAAITSTNAYVPGAVRAAALATNLSGSMGKTLAKAILDDVGISSKDDLIAVKWLAADKDIETCKSLF